MKPAWETEENGGKQTRVDGGEDSQWGWGRERGEQREGMGRCSSERRQGEQMRARSTDNKLEQHRCIAQKRPPRTAMVAQRIEREMACICIAQDY